MSMTAEEIATESFPCGCWCKGNQRISPCGFCRLVAAIRAAEDAEARAYARVCEERGAQYILPRYSVRHRECLACAAAIHARAEARRKEAEHG